MRAIKSLSVSLLTTMCMILSFPMVGAIENADSAYVGNTEYNRVTVTDYGAVPDDKNDDTKAINKALACAKNDSADEICEVYVPSGKYYINAKLIIYSNTRLILADDAVITGTAGNIMLLQWVENEKEENAKNYDRFHNIYISGGTWDAGGVGNGDKNVSKSIMFFNNGKDVTITNTTFCNCYGNHFLNFEGVDGITVTDTVFKDFVSYVGSTDTYDFVKDIPDPEKQKSAIGAAEALHVDFATIDDSPCRNIKVTRCRFSNVPSGVGTHHIKSKYADNVEIFDNYFEDIWYYCVRISSFHSTRIYNNVAVRAGSMFRSQDSVAEVFNNTLTGLPSLLPSRYDVNGTLYSVLIQDNSSISFHDNILKSTIGIGAAYIDNGSKSNTFTRNTIDSPTVDGMFIEKTKLSVTLNNIVNCGRSGVKSMTSQVTCENNNITGCKYRFADFYKGSTASTCRNNGITPGTESFFSKDSSVTVSDNLPSISELSLNIPLNTYKYTGSAIKPDVALRNGSGILSSDNYTVSYSNNISPGNGEILVEGKGKYRGFIIKNFRIIKYEKPAPFPETSIKGDSNGDGVLNVRDAANIAKMLASGWNDVLPPQSDFNGDGKINVRDAAGIGKYLSASKR